MALKSTIYKARLTVSNLNIHHYHDYALTVARHPSENNLRMMVRLLAFAMSSEEEIQFTKGLSSDSEPDLWKINHDASIEHWIELGLPDERHLRQICSKANKVTVYTYHGAQAQQWFEGIRRQAQRFSHLKIVHFVIPDDGTLEHLVEKGMNLNISIEDSDIWVSNESERLCVEFQIAKDFSSFP